MAKFVPVDPFELVIFGGTGDLAQRKLLPALFHRFLDGQIDSTTKLVGVARSDMKTKAYRAFAREACKRTLNDEDWDEAKWAEFAQYLDYVQMDATAKDADWAALKKLLPAKQGPRVFYLATAPRLYVSICEGLGAAKLVRKDARVVLEKPIGTNLETAAEINDGVAKVFAEDSVYRIDH
ncbi:MAG: glucose-6-phosphate dehydrogenase, partial [Pseudomonadota bacterium]